MDLVKSGFPEGFEHWVRSRKAPGPFSFRMTRWIHEKAAR
jgi:hypothetical protein